ncbi:MAG: DUF1015 domain-containing protein [Ferruginibacter sp.]
MITISPFAALRPEVALAKAVASRPYDVLSSKEARTEAQGNPTTFLHITKSEIDLPETVDVHSQEVYEKAKENLAAFVSRNILFKESKPCYYIYELTMNGRAQVGLVCGSSVNDYENGLIKKHEFTRPEKELDRITHIKTTGAQTGNVFIAYRNVVAIDEMIAGCMKEKSPQYSFVADDGVQHNIWVINDETNIAAITNLFMENVPATYIADGHHRAASAAKVRAALGNDATENADIFLTTLFPSDQLSIMDYNRVIKDLNGYSAAKFLEKLKFNFTIEKQKDAYRPTAIHEFGLYIDNKWYSIKAKKNIIKDDVLGILDINILQENVLTPLLNIIDQRTDARIDFVGGIRGLEELEKKVDSGEMAMAISLYPVSMAQLFAVADSGEVMPPKSTWFEPKLRDGLLTHLIN